MGTITKRSVLITGCSDGSLGAALSLRFVRHNFHVIPILRNPAKAGSLASHPDIEILSLKVTSSPSIAFCAAIVEKKTGVGLDILVNNAGIMFVMPLLDTNIEESKKMYDVNVWGLLAVTQAFAPMLVRSKAVMLNIAGIAGAVRMAWQGSFSLEQSLLCLFPPFALKSGSSPVLNIDRIFSIKVVTGASGCLRLLKSLSVLAFRDVAH